MTTPNGPILFNNSTGSDSQASGLGPATAIYGSNASLNGSIVDVSADISFININPGDLIYCDTSTGRKFSVIMMVDATTFEIYTDDSWPTESGVSWAIGGKRATFDNASSRRLFAEDTIFMCRVQTETDQALTSPLGGNGAIVKVIATGTSHKVITISGVGNAMFHGGWFRLQNFKLEALDNNPLLFSDATSGTTVLRCQDCVVGHPTNSFSTICSSSSGSRISFLSGTVVQNIGNGGNLHSRDKLAITEIDGTLMKDCGKIDKWSDRNGTPSTYSVFIGTGSNNLIYQRYLNWYSYGCVYYKWGNMLTGSAYSNITLRSCIVHTVVNPIGSTSFGGGFINSYEYNRTGTLVYSPYINELATIPEEPFSDAVNQDFNINTKQIGGAILRSNKITL